MTDKDWTMKFHKGMNALCRAIHERELLIAKRGKSGNQGQIVSINFKKEK